MKKVPIFAVVYRSVKLAENVFWNMVEKRRN